MFLRCHERKKDGKLHHYWSIVESRRVAGGPPVRRQVLYLGEISDNQEAAWRKSIEVFDEEKETPEQFCLFSSDKVIADDQVNALSLVLSEMRLLRPRSFGDCWLGCLLWDELGLLKRVAVLQKEAGRVKSFVKIREPGIQEPVNRQTFVCTFDRAAWKASLGRDGSYILLRLDPVGRLPGGDGEKGTCIVGMVHATGSRGGGVQDPQE
jgi:hypothetical protein